MSHSPDDAEGLIRADVAGIAMSSDTSLWTALNPVEETVTCKLMMSVVKNIMRLARLGAQGVAVIVMILVGVGKSPPMCEYVNGISIRQLIRIFRSV